MQLARVFIPSGEECHDCAMIMNLWNFIRFFLVSFANECF